MKFAWDPQKAESNLRKHKVGFEEAMTVFQDTLAFIFYDTEHSQAEHREIIIGTSALSRIILVCFGESPGYDSNFQRTPRNERRDQRLDENARK